MITLTLKMETPLTSEMLATLPTFTQFKDSRAESTSTFTSFHAIYNAHVHQLAQNKNHHLSMPFMNMCMPWATLKVPLRKIKIYWYSCYLVHCMLYKPLRIGLTS
jgi:hypothetical protein